MGQGRPNDAKAVKQVPRRTSSTAAMLAREHSENWLLLGLAPSVAEGYMMKLPAEPPCMTAHVAQRS